MCLYNPSLQCLALLILEICEVMGGSKGPRGGRRESGCRGCWPPPPDRAGSAATCGFAIITTQLCCLLWPARHDHRPPHPRPAKSCPKPHSSDFSQFISCHNHVAIAGFWGEAQDLSIGRGLGGQRTQPPTGQDRHWAFQRKFPLNLFWFLATEQYQEANLQGDPRGRFLFGTYYLRTWPQRKSLKEVDRGWRASLETLMIKSSHMREGSREETEAPGSSRSHLMAILSPPPSCTLSGPCRRSSPFSQQLQRRRALVPALHHPRCVKGGQEAAGTAGAHGPKGLQEKTGKFLSIVRTPSLPPLLFRICQLPGPCEALGGQRGDRVAHRDSLQIQMCAAQATRKGCSGPGTTNLLWGSKKGQILVLGEGDGNW